MVRFTIVAVTDSRTEKEDNSGRAVAEEIEKTGHEVLERLIVKNDFEAIQKTVSDAKGDIVITMGGTGISSKDITPEALKPLLDKELYGFGELFRMLSYKDIGTSTMMSRSFAGTFRGTAVFCLPGSTSACVLATREIILKECEHLIKELRK